MNPQVVGNVTYQFFRYKDWAHFYQKTKDFWKGPIYHTTVPNHFIFDVPYYQKELDKINDENEAQYTKSIRSLETLLYTYESVKNLSEDEVGQYRITILERIKYHKAFLEPYTIKKQ
jgi:hypothetical protein